MTSSRMSQTSSTSNSNVLTVGDKAYYAERLRMRLYEAVLTAFEDEARAGRVTKAGLARRLKKDPAQITRWLSGPSNWRIDTISDLLLALDAELDPSVAFFRDRAMPNFQHPLLSDTSETPKATSHEMPRLQPEITGSQSTSSCSSATWNVHTVLIDDA